MASVAVSFCFQFNYFNHFNFKYWFPIRNRHVFNFSNQSPPPFTFSPASLEPQTPLLSEFSDIREAVGALAALAGTRFTEKQLRTSTPFILEMLAKLNKALIPPGATFFFGKTVNTGKTAVCK